MCPYCISLKQKIALWGCNINACKKMKKTHLAVWLHTGISISTQTVHDNSPFMCRPKLALTGPACHQGPPNDPRPTTRAGSLRRRRMPRTESYRRSCNQRPQELWKRSFTQESPWRYFGSGCILFGVPGFLIAACYRRSDKLNPYCKMRYSDAVIKHLFDNALR